MAYWIWALIIAGSCLGWLGIGLIIRAFISDFTDWKVKKPNSLQAIVVVWPLVLAAIPIIAAISIMRLSSPIRLREAYREWFPVNTPEHEPLDKGSAYRG